MKLNKHLILLIAIFTITIQSGFSQSIPFKGPDNTQVINGFFPIGWTIDGKVFAYGCFSSSIMISNSAKLEIVVQNIVSDKIVWRKEYNWDEGNVGDGSGDIVPSSAKEAWDLHSFKIKDKLFTLNIDKLSDNLKSLPYQTADDSIQIEIRLDKKKSEYRLLAGSLMKGVKTISSGSYIINGIQYDLSLVGYVANPSKSRIAVVLYLNSFQPYPLLKVIGCSVRSGFEREGR